MGKQILTTPSVRRLAKEHSIDLEDVPASGPGDRILKSDVLEYIRMQASSPPTEQTTAESVAPSAQITVESTSKPVAQYLEADTEVSLTREFRFPFMSLRKIRLLD
jgi:pyruvate/2-oxoglutarate dehydrogenase complex dihydrolipoamide acyltransferase (E2) component